MQFDIANLDPEKAAVIENLFPEMAKDLIRVVGLKATLTIIRICGGTEISFPSTGNGGGEVFQLIEEAIGKDKADGLRYEFGAREPIYIPVCYRAMKELRNIEIIRAYDEKTKTKSGRRATCELALEYRLSSRAVEIITGGGYRFKGAAKHRQKR